MVGMGRLGCQVLLGALLGLVGCGSAEPSDSTELRGPKLEQVGEALVTAPAITSFTPAKAAQGALVTINGAGFVAGASVSFNGTPSLSVTFLSTSRLRAVAPANCTTGPITVSVPRGTAVSSAPFLVLPKLTSLSQSQGFVGDFVTVSGSGFTGTTSVKFGSVAASFNVDSDSSVTAAVPGGFTSGKLTLTTPQGGVVTPTAFAVLPLLTAFSPAQGTVGQSVSITGAGFSIANAVKFGTKAAAFTIVSDTQISATVPVGAATSKLSVETPRGNRTSSSSFTLIKAPTISSFTPATSALPVTLTINGTNFSSTTAVQLGSVVLPAFTVVSSTRLTASVPDWTPSGSVTVTNPAGTATSAATFVAIQCADQDGDKVCDAQDQCPGFDDHVDTDADGIADGCDRCPSAVAAGQECGPGLACDAAGGCSVEVACNASTPGSGVFHGNAVVDGVSTASDLAALAGKWCVTGNLYVTGTFLHDLAGLSSLVEVAGDVNIGGSVPGCSFPCASGNVVLTSFDGLQQLRRVGGYLHFEDGYSSGITSLAPLANLKSATAFSIWGANALTDLHGLEGLRAISQLSIERAAKLTSLSGIQNLRSASYVRLADAPLLTDMTQLAGITEAAEEFSVYRTGLSSLAGAEQLTSAGLLYIADNPNLTDLTPLSNVRTVSSLGISNQPGLTSLAAFAGLTSAVDVWLTGLGITSLAGLQNLTSLQNLELRYDPALVDLSALSQLQGSLNLLSLEENASLGSLAALSGLGVRGQYQLKNNALLVDCGNLDVQSTASVIFENNPQLSSLTCLEGKARLSYLSLIGNPAITSLEAVSSLTGVDDGVLLHDNSALASIGALRNLTSLRSFSLSNEPLLVDLDGLQGLTALYNFDVGSMASLSSLHGLENLGSVYGSLSFDNNPELPQCAISELEAQLGRPVSWNQGNTGTASCEP